MTPDPINTFKITVYNTKHIKSTTIHFKPIQHFQNKSKIHIFQNKIIKLISVVLLVFIVLFGFCIFLYILYIFGGQPLWLELADRNSRRYMHGKFNIRRVCQKTSPQSRSDTAMIQNDAFVNRCKYCILVSV